MTRVALIHFHVILLVSEDFMTKKVIVLLAEGFEEVEAVTPIDYLRRAEIEITIAAVGETTAVKGAHGLKVCADVTLNSLLKEGKLSASAWSGVITPGGRPGSDNLAASGEVGEFLKEMHKAGKWLFAICSAPARVLAPLGLLKGKKFTCYPGEEAKVTDAEWSKDRVVIDGNLITSRGAGTAGEFACAIIDKLIGAGEGGKIAEHVVLY